jgi:signal transduction histidine kinase
VLNIDPHIPAMLYGNRTILVHALDALMDNAVKFSEAGRIKIDVRLSEVGQPSSTKAWVRFDIADQGVGISTEAQGRLFELFNQADNSQTRRYGGAGIGLALCKRLVEKMRGEIGFESTPGQGSTFWVVVPFDLDGPEVPSTSLTEK